MLMDKKDSWIQEFVAGKQFVDLGGLWACINEKVSIALFSGAREATMVDIQPLGNALWQEFDARCERLGVSGYRRICADINADDLKDRLGTFDLVHCSGVLYHLPQPMHALLNLKRITAKRLIIASMVVPEWIENTAGTLELGTDRCLFVPGMSESIREIMTQHFNDLEIRVAGINQALPYGWMIDHDTVNYSPWWWLYSPSFLKGMIESVGLKILDSCWSWDNRAFSVYAERY
jgi:SAM-dependent methyltransferase